MLDCWGRPMESTNRELLVRLSVPEDVEKRSPCFDTAPTALSLLMTKLLGILSAQLDKARACCNKPALLFIHFIVDIDLAGFEVLCQEPAVGILGNDLLSNFSL